MRYCLWRSSDQPNLQSVFLNRVLLPHASNSPHIFRSKLFHKWKIQNDHIDQNCTLRKPYNFQIRPSKIQHYETTTPTLVSSAYTRYSLSEPSNKCNAAFYFLILFNKYLTCRIEPFVNLYMYLVFYRAEVIVLVPEQVNLERSLAI